MRPPSVVDGLLDRSILFSFDRTGFARHRRRFREEDLDVDLRGRKVAITGANAGLGRATAEALLDRGAHVYLLCRDPARGEAARAELSARGRAELVLCDVAEKASVRAAAAALPSDLAVLVHNAGVLVDAFERTADGLERTWATNVVGPHLLTRLLLPRLRAVEDARVLTVTSGGLYGVALDAEVALRAADPRPPARFDGVRAYAHTKRAQLALSDLLARAEPQVAFHAMHPGWADTGGVRRSLPTFRALTKGILRSPEQGADTVVWLAAAPRDRLEPTTGGFWFDRAPAPRHLRLGPRARHEAAEVERLRAIVDAQAA